MFFDKRRLPVREEALPGRAEKMPVPEAHFVNGARLVPPFPEGLEQALFGMGCFWGAEKKFWQLKGVYSTAVGYASGHTPNPTYREEYFGGTPAPGDTYNEAILAANKGKRLPIVGRVEVYIVEEQQPRFLAFLNNEFDMLDRLPPEFANIAIPGNELSGDLKRRGVTMQRRPFQMKGSPVQARRSTSIASPIARQRSSRRRPKVSNSEGR